MKARPIRLPETPSRRRYLLRRGRRQQDEALGLVTFEEDGEHDRSLRVDGEAEGAAAIREDDLRSQIASLRDQRDLAVRIHPVEAAVAADQPGREGARPRAA